MSQFIQLHVLTSYPPANLNRDDQGRPKTAKMGGTDRLRVSSQSLKRAWRQSDLFQEAVGGHIGTRTKLLGREIYAEIIQGEVKEKDAIKWSRDIAGVFGALKKEAKDNFMMGLEIEQLVHISPIEYQAALALACVIKNENREPTKEELDLLRNTEQAVDIALFGRMLASKPAFNIEAACQVAHALSVHSVVLEDDYFTAVDDLNETKEDMGAAHIGETTFAAGLFYSYICINKTLLSDNLSDDELVKKALRSLTEAVIKVAPEGKQNSFASRAYASYVLAEKGKEQPRSLSVAFLKAIDNRNSDDFGTEAIKRLSEQYKSFCDVYELPLEASSTYQLDVSKGQGKLSKLLEFVSE
ncbi:MAG: type I-E CRISPR-associated protein Cas7/Cse4/CasC [Thiotrichaceae bacterium]|nr:type I-E CRISPR-associated protein Cas7/Cse4/CasC [Thiotrichaceae bacterium]